MKRARYGVILFNVSSTDLVDAHQICHAIFRSDARYELRTLGLYACHSEVVAISPGPKMF